MRIAFIHPFSPESVGLNERDVPSTHAIPYVRLWQELQGEGHKVDMLYLSCHANREEHVNGLLYSYNKVLSGSAGIYRREKSLALLRRLVATRYDLIIVNTSGHGGTMPYAVLLLAIVRRTRFLSIIGGSFVRRNPILEWYYGHSALVGVHTMLQAVALRNQQWWQSEIFVLHLGVEVPETPPPAVTDCMAIRLLYVGRLVRWKNVDAVLRVAGMLYEQHPSVVCDIVGLVSDASYHAELLDYIENHGMQSYVRMHHQVKNSDVSRFYSSSYAMLLLSEHDSYGIVVAESFAHGTPVVAYRRSPGPRELITNGIDGYLVDSESECFQRLQYLLEHPDEYQAMRQAAHASAVNKYSCTRMTQVMRGILGT